MQILPLFEELKADRLTYARSFYTQYLNTDAFNGKRLVEPYSDYLYVVQNPPALPLTEIEMDDIYSLPYMRTYHPSYDKTWRSSCYLRDPVQPHQQPGLFWRMQFLCIDLSSGTDHPDPQPPVTFR